ncbi:VOC family protein [Actinacidiphila guanduensis]|uniref:Glyoxalase/Bleomycin resistance protein/Dioxygenase superfamily protein n=1 Tax=Actinacidiphila guanduensis TaxID=310781 RepID=A0A1H0SDC5_9ACTN|nr:VOC family protein [Actinacidiphila guanduensis]SDP39791.1 Glyoxalase/Bleomycin resistance protein/Dioxygenase superfamily protein [Actinacidiphila guanduensis]
MSLHRLISIIMGVPDVAGTTEYYADFGLTREAGNWFTSQDGGRQLQLVSAPSRRLLEIRIGVDDADDLGSAASRLRRLGVRYRLTERELTAEEAVTGVRAVLEVAPRLVQPEVRPTPYNLPGHTDRAGRAPVLLRDASVRPRKLGHAVVATTDFDATTAFFRDGLGFKASDYIKGEGAFLRCSPEHHNLLVLAFPVVFLHHTSWQVDDVDEVGRGAFAMLEHHPERHVWGLGRHYAGSNFFWYLKDPSGTFSEYYADMDCIVDDQMWKPEVLEGARGLFSWGPPPPPSFLRPDDLAALMTGSHSAR